MAKPLHGPNRQCRLHTSTSICHSSWRHGSPCTTRLGLGSKPGCLCLLRLWGVGAELPVPLQLLRLHRSFVGLCKFRGNVSVFKVLFQVETLLFRNVWVLQMSGVFA